MKSADAYMHNVDPKPSAQDARPGAGAAESVLARELEEEFAPGAVPAGGVLVARPRGFRDAG
jgi:hypothetical protein